MGNVTIGKRDDWETWLMGKVTIGKRGDWETWLMRDDWETWRWETWRLGKVWLWLAKVGGMSAMSLGLSHLLVILVLVILGDRPSFPMVSVRDDWLWHLLHKNPLRAIAPSTKRWQPSLVSALPWLRPSDRRCNRPGGSWWRSPRIPTPLRRIASGPASVSSRPIASWATVTKRSPWPNP
jgi:hypothetical protein